MAQEIVVRTWCDVCLEAQENSPGQAFAVESSIGGGKPAKVEADLCERHGKELVQTLEWLAAIGRRSRAGTTRAPGADQARLCPECGQPAKNRTGLIQHLTRRHSLELEEAQAKADQAQPVPVA